MSGWHPVSWEEALRRLVAEGATDEEVWEFVPKKALPIAERRRLEGLLVDLRGGPWWDEFVEAYRRAGNRPTELEVAEQLGFTSEQPVRDRLRPLGIARWHEIHARMRSATPRPPTG